MGNKQNSFGPSGALDIDRETYNAAFGELGLGWYWDAKTYAELQVIPEERNRVRTYVETHVPHLLRAYDADFLVNAIESKRAQLRSAMEA